ncbi:hypothetical protein B0H14DRAFT_2638306 [Mycena olivaceomarginata]|nr:hypothetical protein B0H14DRAFT_2638306 [Mycena olivaceomarginata]
MREIAFSIRLFHTPHLCEPPPGRSHFLFSSQSLWPFLFTILLCAYSRAFIPLCAPPPCCSRGETCTTVPSDGRAWGSGAPRPKIGLRSPTPPTATVADVRRSARPTRVVSSDDENAPDHDEVEEDDSPEGKMRPAGHKYVITEGLWFSATAESVLETKLSNSCEEKNRFINRSQKQGEVRAARELLPEELRGN